MKLGKIIRRFLVPSPIITLIYALKFRCFISPRAEVELSPLLKIGRRTKIGSFTKIKASDGPLSIGEQSSIGTCCFISSGAKGVSIGNYSMISSNVVILGDNYLYNDLDTPTRLQQRVSKGVEIGENVWIGVGAVVLDGSTIGSGCIITPNSVVSGKLPPNSIAQGNPATVIFTRR